MSDGKKYGIRGLSDEELNARDAEAAQRDAAYGMAVDLGWTPGDAEAPLGQPLLEPLHVVRRAVLQLEGQVGDLEGKAEDFERDYATEGYVDEELDRRLGELEEAIPSDDRIKELADEQIEEAKGEYEGLCEVRDGWAGLVDQVERLESILADNMEMRAALTAQGLLPCPLCKAPARRPCPAECPNPGGRPQRGPSLGFFAYQSQDPDSGNVPPRWRVLPRWLLLRARAAFRGRS